MTYSSLSFDSAAERLVYYLKCASMLRAQVKRSPNPAAHRALKIWQTERLARAHAELRTQARYQPAVEFFLQELYGPKDFTARDEEVARVIPVMVRFLPDRALQTLADAIEMDALSESLDNDMVTALTRSGHALSIDRRSYGIAFREVGRREERELQVKLVERMGVALEHLTNVPLLRSTLRMMRKPAHMAGLGTLQEFLESGFAAFHHMGKADEFLESVVSGEKHYVESLFNGSDG